MGNHHACVSGIVFSFSDCSCSDKLALCEYMSSCNGRWENYCVLEWCCFPTSVKLLSSPHLPCLLLALIIYFPCDQGSSGVARMQSVEIRDTE